MKAREKMLTRLWDIRNTDALDRLIALDAAEQRHTPRAFGSQMYLCI